MSRPDGAFQAIHTLIGARPGRWLLLVFVWASVLAPPCWFLALPYQRWLGGVLSVVLQLAGIPIRVTGLGVSTPFEMGLFAALCLASTGAGLPRRLWALVVGLALMVVAEVVVLALAFALEFVLSAAAARGPGTREALRSLRELIVWVLAPGAWLVVLGRARSAAPARARARRS